MIKIKDNVDLKDLEKFGFVFRANILYKPSYKDKDLIDISINQETREVIEEDKKIERITNEAFLNSPFGELVGGKFNEIIDALNEISERLNETYNDRTELKNEVNRLNNIINESTEEILKELEENHHLSYGVALVIRQKLLDYKELKGSDKD